MLSNQHAVRDPTVKYFWGIVATHFVLWTLVCWLTQPNMPLDMIEMLFWGQQWQLGYHKHPPLPAWIAASTWWLGGSQPIWMYVVSQLTIVATFWAVWQLAREGLSPWAALCSVVILEGCYYCTFTSNDINNTIVMRPCWALAALFLYRALTRDASSVRNLNWILTGAVIGLGMLSKYNMGVLVLSMMFIPVLLRRSRSSLKTVGPYLLVGLALLIFLPHLVWMIQNEFVTIKYAFRRSGDPAVGGVLGHLLAPMSFMGAQLGAVIPMLVLTLPMIREWRRLSKSDFEQSKRDVISFVDYLAVVFLGPLVIYTLVGLILGVSFRSMWGGPLFSLFGVWLFSKLKMPDDPKKVRKILRDSILMGFFMLTALAVRNVASPLLRDKLSRVHFPGYEASKAIHQKWQSEFDSPLTAIGGDMFIAGSINVWSPQRIDVYEDLSSASSPWLSDDEFRSRGAMIVWQVAGEDESPPAHWMKQFPTAKQLDTMHLPRRSRFGPREVKMGVLMLAPAARDQPAATVD